MSKRNYLAAALAACCAVSAAEAETLDPAPVKLGFVNLYPLLKLEQRYDDNLFLQATDEQESWQTVVAPQMKAVALDGPNEYALDYKAEAGFFDRSADDNYVDHLVSAYGRWAPLSRHRFELSGSYQQDHDRRGTEYFEGEEALLIDEPARFHRETILGRYAYGAEEARGRIEFEVKGSDKTYTNHRETTERRDRLDLYGTATFLWRIAGRTRALFEVSRGGIDYENDPPEVSGAEDRLDSVYTSYLAGVTWKFADKTSGTLKAGHATKNFVDSDREDFAGTSWAGEVSWAPKSYSVFTLMTGRRADESKGRGDFIDATDWGLDWRHGWSDRIESKIFYLRSDETYEEDPEGREDEISRYGLRIDYAMRRWLGLGIFYVHDRRESTLEEFTYARDVSGLSLRMSL